MLSIVNSEKPASLVISNFLSKYSLDKTARLITNAFKSIHHHVANVPFHIIDY